MSFDHSESIYRGELIGTHIRVKESEHEGFQGIDGRVIDETMNLLVIDDGSSKIKKIPKEGKLFRVKKQNEQGLVKGDLLIHRPEDRIKKAG